MSSSPSVRNQATQIDAVSPMASTREDRLSGVVQGNGRQAVTGVLAQDMSEHAVTPKFFLMHDPNAFGALCGLSEAKSNEESLERFLFRERPDLKQHRQQHAGLVSALREEIEVVLLSDVLSDEEQQRHAEQLRFNPNLVFTHDAMITVPWIPDVWIRANMRKEPRCGEPAVLATVAARLGLRELLAMPPHLYLEGGDVMPLCYSGRRALLVGYGPRTSEGSLHYLRETLVKDGLIDEIVGIRLAPWRLNIDGCFFPVSSNTIVTNRDSVLNGVVIDWRGSRPIDPFTYFPDHGFRLEEVTREESFFQQVCNFACLGNNRLVAYAMNERVNHILKEHGLDVRSIPGDQLVKGNGGPHCMTRPIYRTRN